MSDWEPCVCRARSSFARGVLFVREGTVWVRPWPALWSQRRGSSVDLSQSGVLWRMPVTEVCWTPCFALGTFVSSVIGRVLVTRLGILQAKAPEVASAGETWWWLWTLDRKRPWLLLWALLRSVSWHGLVCRASLWKLPLQYLFPFLEMALSCLFLFGVNGTLEQKRSDSVVWALWGTSKDYFHILFVLN